MHVAIDARRYDSGMWIYLSCLIDDLREIDKTNTYSLLVHHDKANMFAIDDPRFKLVPTKLAIENHWQGEFFRHVIMPKRLLEAGVDVFHDPGYFLPILGKRLKKVVTFHDMVPFIHKETNSRKYFTYMRTVLRVSAKLADLIIADSENTKVDIMNILKLPPEKIRVIHLAARMMFEPMDHDQASEEVRGQLKIQEPYILNVGTIEPRKNILRLLKAYHRLRSERNLPHKLVIVGPIGWLYKPVLQAINQLDLDDDVIITGYVEDADLVKFYNGADLFIFPSLYEGFGLPPLEALACGVPVAASCTSCLPEILGEAAEYFDPYSTDEIAAAIMNIIDDEERREYLREAGPKQAAKFSWQQTAEKTLAIYKELAS